MHSSNWKLFKSMIRNPGSEALSREMIGFTLEAPTAPVISQDVIAYANATKDNSPAYKGNHAPVPPFFLSKLMFPMIQEICLHQNLRMNLLRMVHAEQEILWHKPICVGDSPDVRFQIRDIYDTPAGEMIQVSGKAYIEGELAAEGISGFIIRSKSGQAKKKKKEEAAYPRHEQFRIEIQTDEGQQLKYATASGDHNFIHTNYLLAKMAGLPRTIMHGICVMAMTCSALAKQAVDGDVERLAGIRGRFAHPTLPGQKLTLVGYDSPHEGVIPFEVCNPFGKPVLKNGLFRFDE